MVWLYLWTFNLSHTDSSINIMDEVEFTCQVFLCSAASESYPFSISGSLDFQMHSQKDFFLLNRRGGEAFNINVSKTSFDGIRRILSTLETAIFTLISMKRQSHTLGLPLQLQGQGARGGKSFPLQFLWGGVQHRLHCSFGGLSGA